MAYTLEQIRAFSAAPNTVPGAGSYGEGQVYQIVEMVKNLKDQIKTGKLTVSEYFDVAEPLIKQAQAKTQSISSGGQKKAQAVEPAYRELQSIGAIKEGGTGGWQAVLPFSAREYAGLPEAVLPTQKDVQSGLVPLDLLPPIQRFRPDPAVTPQVNPAIDPATGLPTTNPTAPTNPGQTIGSPVVGDPLQNSVPKVIDQSVIEQESIRQAEQQRQAFEAQNALSQQRMDQLRGLLTQQEDQQFDLAKPGIYEDLNTKGLLRSSGLGTALAKEKAALSASTNNQLSQTALGDTDRQIKSIADILAQQQSFQTSGLERRFTLEDFNKEANLAKSLGATNAPQIKGGNSVLGGVLGGAVSGAGAGAALGPWGAGAGAVLGAAGGGATSKGK